MQLYLCMHSRWKNPPQQGAHKAELSRLKEVRGLEFAGREMCNEVKY